MARRLLLGIPGASAAVAVLAGLARMDVAPGWGGSYSPAHGPLLVFGALGTVIALERAVLSRQRWTYVAPVLGAILCVGVLTGFPGSPELAVASALALVVVDVAIVRARPSAFAWLMLAGSGALLTGAIVWTLDSAPHRLVPLWMAFLVITIVAERVEISRLSPMSSRTVLLAASIVGGFAGSACAAAFGMPQSLRVFGVTTILVGLWQLQFDMARRSLDRPGLPRFAAVGVLSGTVWLVFTGVLLAAAEIPPAGPLYDAALHATFVGYVLSMIFSHAPFILPLVASVNIPFTPWLYLPLVLLHTGLVIRVAGDLTGVFVLRQAGGVANAAALVLFILVSALVRPRERPSPRPAGG